MVGVAVVVVGGGLFVGAKGFTARVTGFYLGR